MNKKLAAALSGGAALVVALSGCGDDSAEKTDAWAKKVCGQVGPQVNKINKASKTMQEASDDREKSGKEIQQTDSKAFQQNADAYKTLANTVRKAGVPPVDNGKKIQQDSVKSLNSISSKYADLKKEIDDLDASKPEALYKGLRGIAPKLDSLGKNGGQAVQKLQSGDLGEAMAKQDGCKRASAPATKGS